MFGTLLKAARHWVAEQSPSQDSADMALRLAACFETTPEFWLNLQLTYDLRKAEIERGEAIKAQVQRIAHCA